MNEGVRERSCYRDAPHIFIPGGLNICNAHSVTAGSQRELLEGSLRKEAHGNGRPSENGKKIGKCQGIFEQQINMEIRLKSHAPWWNSGPQASGRAHQACKNYNLL